MRLLLLMGAVCQLCTVFAETGAPNIVLILADDMGPGEPGFAGGLVPTPSLDQMAKEGMQFTDAHTTSSVCTPTRYGILTGRYNWRSRLKKGVLVAVDAPALMDPARLSLPKFLQQCGYSTGCIGKWHLGANWQILPPGERPKRGKQFGSWNVDYEKPFRNGPTDVGFDQAFFILSSLDMPPYLYLRDDRAVAAPTVERGFPHNEYNDYERIGAAAADFDPSNCLGDWARESRHFIQRHAKKDAPFFLYLPLSSPHTPVRPGKAFKGRYPQFSSYADFVAETDWVVGQVLDQLQESEVDDNTLVIFTSDNGFAPYVKIPRMFAAGYQPSGPFRGSKASLYEGGHRVPFLVRWPKRVAPGSRCDSTICTTDFFMTFAELIGTADAVPAAAAEDSFSFVSCLDGGTAVTRPFTVHHGIGGAFAIRKGDWKLILSKSGGGGWGELPGQEKISTPAKVVQLYNLAADPGETKNLESDAPERVLELVNDLAVAMRQGRTTPGPPQSNEGWPYLHKPTLKVFPQLREEQR